MVRLVDSEYRERPEPQFTLADGAFVRVRRISPEDERSMVEIFRRSSPRSLYQRFFTEMPVLTAALLHRLANVDYNRRLALIAESDAGPVGVVRYEPAIDPGAAELAILVVDEWQNRGLGRILLRELFRAAEENGIQRFCAHVLADNQRMFRLLATEAKILHHEFDGGVAEFWLIPCPAASGADQ